MRFLISPSVQRERLVDLAVDGDLPPVRILRLVRNQAVVADEELARRRRLIVEHVLRRLGDQGLVAEHHEALLLAGEVEDLRPALRLARAACRRGGARRRRPLRQRGRDQARRHRVSERDGRADRSSDPGEPGAVEEAAAADVGAAAEHQGVGPLGILGIEFLQGTLDPRLSFRHGFPPPLATRSADTAAPVFIAHPYLTCALA